jgi:hypothetical protein
VKTWDLSRSAACACLAATLLAGCGATGTAPQIGAGIPSTLVLPAKWRESLFVSNPPNVDILASRTWRQVGTIRNTYSNGGSWVDGNGNLYVVDDSPKSAKVLEYAPNTIKPKFIYSKQLLEPSNVETDRSGDVFVTDGSIVFEYPQGINWVEASCGTRTSSSFGAARGVAVDGASNVWVSYQDFGTTVTYPPRLRPCVGEARQFLPSAGDMAFDANDNLLVCDDKSGKIDILSPPSYDSIAGTFGSGYKRPIRIRINKSNTLAYVTDRSLKKVFVFSYPGGELQHTLGLRNPYSAVYGDNYQP